jgi:hypothetical protein
VSVAEDPAQILVLLDVAVSDGSAFTVTFTTALAIQPARLAPVTEYEVLAVGVTITLLPLSAPGFHV